MNQLLEICKLSQNSSALPDLRARLHVKTVDSDYSVQEDAGQHISCRRSKREAWISYDARRYG